VVAEANAPGLRVAGRPVPPGTQRLVRPGERAELQGNAIAVELAPQAEGTRAAARALLRDAAAGGTPVAGPRLVVLTGPAAGSRHPLGAEQTLGRGRGAAIRIPDPQASRVHARVRLEAAGATIEDLGSKNGVRVNGVRIDGGPCPLGPADELGIGETALAVEEVELAADAVAAGPRPAPRIRRPSAHLLAAALLALSAAALALAAG
jgi:hypothetical protein